MSIMISFVQKKSVKERVWKTLNVIVGISTLLNVSLLGAFAAPRVAQASTTSLSTQILSWDILGVDSNNPVTDGPHKFLIQARVSNTGAASATAVQSTFAWGSGTSYLSLVSAPTFPLNTIAAGASKDVFYVVQVTPPASPNSPSNDVFGKTRPFTITASSPDASNASAGQTLTIENIISQSRNHILSSTVTPPNPLVGQPFTVHVEYETSSTYLDITPQMTYNPAAATLDSVVTNYVTDGVTESDIYTQDHGNTVHSDFHFRAQSAGSLNFFYTVVDHSGNSYHYNDDFSNAIVVPVQPRQALTKSVDKATANPGDALTYTLNYANLGNIDLTNVIVTETYDSHFNFTSALPAPTSSNNIWAIGNLAVGASGTITIHGTLSNAFPVGTTTVHNVAVMTSDQTDPVQATANTTVTVAPNGSLKLTKIVDSGTASPDSFNFTIAPDPNGVGTVHTTGGVYVFGNLPAGSYTITEQALANYHQVSSTCANVAVTQDNQSTCVVHNARDTGGLTLTKVVDSGTASASDFSFTISPDPTGVGTIHTSAGSTGTYTFANLPTGQYTVTEQALSNYHQVSSTCSNVTVVTGQTATCTVHNARDMGNLKVIKHVVGGSAVAGDWQLHAKQGTNDIANSPQASSETGTVYSVPTGQYTVSETGGPVGYTASFSASCPNGVISVTTGQTATCTITNTRDQGHVDFLKVVDNEPNADLSQFTFHANGGAYHSGDSANFDTASYLVTEDAVSGYSFVGASGICSYNPANGQITMNVSTNGGTCTITNHRDTGTLVIQKDVINPDGGPVNDAHSFTVSVSGQSNGTIAEGSDATYSNLPTGTYSVTELADGSYTFVSYSLDNNANAADGAQVTVSKNATTTLLVTNKQKKVQIIVHKNVVGIDGQTDISDSHGFTANVNAASGAIAEGTNFTTSVNPGNVTVSENPDADYALVSITPSNFSVSSGDQPVNVWVVNKQLPAHITVYKDVRAWDGSDTSDGHTFMTTLDGVTKNFGENAPASFAVAPGTYSASEVPDANYTLKSITPDSVTVGSNGNARIDIVNWQNKVFDWTVSKSGPATVQAGGQMTYDITWQVNQGSNSQLANITVTDPLPTHTSFAACSDSCDHATSTISWTIPGPFIPGQTGVVHLTVNVDNHLDPMEITNTATVCGDEQPYFPTLSLSALSLIDINPNHVCKDGSVTTQVLSSYELGVSKTDNQTTTTPGSTYSYTVDWNVDGNAATTSALTVSDTLPAHTSFVSASNGGNEAAGIVTWNLGSQAVPSNGSLTVTVKVDDLVRNGTDLHNTVQICDQSQQCADGDDHTTVVSDYDIQVIKTGSPDPVQAGDDVTYALNWTISGNTPIDGATLTDTLPAGLNFVACSDSCDHSGTPISWDLGSFPSGSGSGSVTITAHVSTPLANGTTYVNNTEVCATSQSVGDHTPVNHCDTDQFTTHVQSDFGVTIDKSDSPDPVEAGSQLTYTLAWTVTGNAPVDALVITDAVPANTTFSSASNSGVNNSGTVTWNLGAHVPGDSGSVTLVVTVASPLINGTQLSNSAQVCGQSNSLVREESVVEHCSTDTETTTVHSDFGVSVIKSAPATITAGAQLTYTLNWSVSGNTPIANVVITDPLPANTTFVSASNGGTNSAGTVTWNLGAHLPGDTGSVTLVVTVTSPVANGTVLTNTATVCGTADNQNESTTQHCAPGTTTTTIQSAPSLSITKTNNVVGFTNPGKTVTYTVTVTNAASATDTAHAVVLTDVLPAGFIYTVGGGSTKNFTLGELIPGQSVVTTYSADISASQTAGTYTNTASAQGSNTSKVSATSNVDVRVPQVLGIVANPALTITKTAKPTTSNPGKVVTYTVTISNTGNADAENVVLTDTLPAGFTFIDTGKSTRTWSLGTLAANHQRVIDYVVKIGANVKAGTYTNVAVVTATGLEPQKASAPVKVIVPKVLGLATTGVSLRDYLTFAAGLALITLGFAWFTRSSRRNEYGRA